MRYHYSRSSSHDLADQRKQGWGSPQPCSSEEFESHESLDAVQAVATELVIYRCSSAAGAGSFHTLTASTDRCDPTAVQYPPNCLRDDLSHRPIVSASATPPPRHPGSKSCDPPAPICYKLEWTVVKLDEATIGAGVSTATWRTPGNTRPPRTIGPREQRKTSWTHNFHILSQSVRGD
ncbi:hypothetical protein RRG08_014044 [Elysia crispata]|uniref:Uncharacterized protein n=1 Tax=Elysia crispata TaxID=231223 RepID=A0AAE1A011_9GAST|nr:hypothetical protein RRG08_014044 [Elysia crispata]